MKCIVTGGAGFIGSHLSDKLIEVGHDVICIDNLITGNKKNIAHLTSNSHFTFREADCTKTLTFNEPADIIFHFASPASPPKYQQYPIETLLVNTLGTYQFLELAKAWKAKFVFASTSEVYGDPEEHPQRTYWGHVNPNGERSCYDESKRAGEAFVMSYIRKYGIDARIVRIFNTYGPRMDIDDGRVVTNLIKQLLNGFPLTIQGDGKQTRSFCYVSDLVAGIMMIAIDDRARGEVLNLGNTEELNVLELAQTLQEIMSTNQTLKFKDLPSDDPQRRRPDITKVSLLGWKPTVSLKEGLTKTIDSFKNK